MAVSTSSDNLAAAQTNTYAITAAKARVLTHGCALDHGGRSDQRHLHHLFTTSSTGALAPNYSTITLAAPAGTVFTLEQLLLD